MKQNGLFKDNSMRPGLVIVFPPGVRSLFNPGVHSLVREVEQRLDGVFVTYALSGGVDPDVAAAVNAVRFAGCGSAVVVPADDWFGGWASTDPGTDVVWTEPAGLADLSVNAQRVVEAYNHGRAASGIAA